MNLALEERETHLSMTADDRSLWAVYTDDPVMARKLERAGAKLVKREKTGGRHYTIPASQVSFRKPRPAMTEAQKAEAAKRLSEARNGA